MFAVGSRIDISIITQAFLKEEEETKYSGKFRNKIDACIFCDESHKKHGLKLLSTFWKHSIKGLVDFK
jgi:hypothetical protein